MVSAIVVLILVAIIIITLNLSKDKGITMSNWEISKLTKEQINYAAQDAIYGYYAFLQCVLNMNSRYLYHDGLTTMRMNIFSQIHC